MLKDTDQKIALITGASRGIGRAIALEFAENGYNLCLNYVQDDEAAKKVRIECEQYSIEVNIIKADVSQSEEVDRVFDSIQRLSGHLSVVVNNAGIRADGPLMLMKQDDWDRVLNINLRSAFLICKKAIRPMISKRKGSIINIVSPSGISGREGQTNYAASKGGLIALTRSLARECAPLGIRVNAVCPGLIETNMITDLKQEILDQFLKAIPINRFGSSQEIANAVSFLADESSSYITGQVLIVDGGLTMGH